MTTRNEIAALTLIDDITRYLGDRSPRTLIGDRSPRAEALRGRVVAFNDREYALSAECGKHRHTKKNVSPLLGDRMQMWGAWFFIR